MNKFLALFILSIIYIHSSVAQVAAKAVSDTIDRRHASAQNPDMPSFKITLVDTVTVFNTSSIEPGKKSVFIIFGPDCIHCRDFFRHYLATMDTMQNVNFYLVTPIRNPNALRSFYNEFNIGAYKNIIATGRDLDFFTMDFFGVSQFPSAILYDEHKKFVRGFRPEMLLPELQQ